MRLHECSVIISRRMPIGLVRDERRKWLRAHASGLVSIEDVTDFLRSARANINDRMWPLMVDARETQCAEIGVRVIRIFHQLDDAERWLDIVSSARELA